MNMLTLKPVLDVVVQISVLFLVILSAHQFAQLTLLPLVSPLEQEVRQSNSNTSIKKQSHTVNISAVRDRNIFGELGAEVIEEQLEEIDAPETKLALVLKGVSVGASDETSSAIISESKRSEGELYWVGDSVAGKASLNAVYDDRVVIKLNGKLETLRFDEESEKTPLTKNKSSNTNRSRNLSNQDNLRDFESVKNKRSEVNRKLTRALNDVARGRFDKFDDLLDEYDGQIGSKIDEAARNAGLKEVDGGFELPNASRQKWMNKIGLKQGDIVRSVNNMSLSTLKNDPTLLSSVARGCNARIEVLRGQNTFFLTYPFCN